MKLKLALLCMLIAGIVPVALCNGDYLHPDMENKYPRDWLEGGYVGILDRASMMDVGIAGMVRWLDAPVPSYPWYGSDVSFYKRLAPASTFTPFSQYYAQAEAPQEAEIISNPVSFNITLGAPKNVFYGTGQGLPFSQYLSTEPSRSSDLWIRGPENWTEYVVSPLGAAVELVANVPGGGSGGFYQTVQTESASLNSRTYQFYDGYNSMIFRADRIGRHLLYFVVNNQPSNVVVIDVFAQAPVAPPSQATVPAQGTQPTLAAPPLQAAQQPSYPLPGSASTSQYPAVAQAPTGTTSLGDTPLTIIYPGPSNFQVFVDGVDVGVGGGGSFSTRVKGGASHVISIWDGFWMYQNNVYFESGVPKVINVEAV